MKNILKFGLLLSVLGLAACGGGGGSSGPSGPVTSTLSFPLNLAYKSLVSSGTTKTFTVSGSCSGTGSYTATPANTPVASVPIVGGSGLSATQTMTATLTNCSGISFAGTQIAYYDTNYNDLGHDAGVGNDYGINVATPVIPASVKVGDTGVVGKVGKYLYGTTTLNGVDDMSYVIEADTANTAIVNAITRSYDVNLVLTDTTQARYRIAVTGALVPVSEDFQAANGSTTHLVIKYN